MQLFFRPTENKYEGEGILPHGTFNNTNEWNPLIKYLEKGALEFPNKITSIRTPIGCYSTIIFMMVLLSISVSGLFSSDDILYDAPLSFLTPNLTSDWTYIHNILHYFLYILIGIHILAILYYQIVKKMKIIERVLDGYSRIEKINIVSINEKPLIGIFLLLILTFSPILILLYFN